jgi:hypothetical protein
MPADIADDFAAAGGMADIDGVLDAARLVANAKAFGPACANVTRCKPAY